MKKKKDKNELVGGGLPLATANLPTASGSSATPTSGGHPRNAPAPMESKKWPLVKIDAISERIAIGPFGSRMKADTYTVSGVRVIRGTNIASGRVFSGDWVYISENFADELMGCNAFENDLVFPHRGSIGEVGIVPRDGMRYVISSSLMLLRCNKQLADPLFLFYFFKSDLGRHELLKNASQVGTPGIGQPLSSLRSIEIPLPPIKEQKRIAEILSSLDDKVESNRRINQTMEQMAQALFQSWFVDFDPVKAKQAVLEAGGSAKDAELAAMQAISGKSAAELKAFKKCQPEQYAELEATAKLFPNKLVECELGLIPEGWEVSSIGKEVQVLGGGTPSTINLEFWENGDIHWTTPKDLSNQADKILLSTDRKITEKGLAAISSQLMPVDTVLMSSRAPVGYLALTKIPVAVNQGYIAMRCDRMLTPEFIIQWCSAVMDDIKQRASGTTFAEISKKVFGDIPVILPSVQIIQAYSGSAKSIYDSITNNAIQMQELTETRDSLLPRLLSGEISITK